MMLAICAVCTPAEPGDTGDTGGSPGTASTAMSASDTGVGEDSATTGPTTGGDDTSWSAGVAVTLSVQREDDFHEGVPSLHVLMRRDDDELLISATDSSIDEQVHTRFAPVVVELVEVCGDEDYVPLRVDFTLSDAMVSIMSGHRDRLPISEDQVFVIDVEQATTSSYHNVEGMKILLRRVDSST